LVSSGAYVLPGYQVAFDGKQIMLAGAGRSTDAKPPRNSRTVTGIEDDGHSIIHRQFGTAEEAKSGSSCSR